MAKTISDISKEGERRKEEGEKGRRREGGVREEGGGRMEGGWRMGEEGGKRRKQEEGGKKRKREKIRADFDKVKDKRCRSCSGKFRKFNNLFLNLRKFWTPIFYMIFRYTWNPDRMPWLLVLPSSYFLLPPSLLPSFFLLLLPPSSLLPPFSFLLPPSPSFRPTSSSSLLLPSFLPTVLLCSTIQFSFLTPRPGPIPELLQQHATRKSEISKNRKKQTPKKSKRSFENFVPMVSSSSPTWFYSGGTDGYYIKYDEETSKILETSSHVLRDARRSIKLLLRLTPTGPRDPIKFAWRCRCCFPTELENSCASSKNLKKLERRTRGENGVESMKNAPMTMMHSNLLLEPRNNGQA
jgi:hypothetical protein